MSCGRDCECESEEAHDEMTAEAYADWLRGPSPAYVAACAKTDMRSRGTVPDVYPVHIPGAPNGRP